jgi:hypothetical protein
MFLISQHLGKSDKNRFFVNGNIRASKTKPFYKDLLYKNERIAFEPHFFKARALAFYLKISSLIHTITCLQLFENGEIQLIVSCPN